MKDLKKAYLELCEVYLATYTQDELMDLGKSVTSAKTLEEVVARGAFIMSMNVEQFEDIGYGSWDNWCDMWWYEISRIMEKHYADAK